MSKTISILGDSLSAYAGTIPYGYYTHYTYFNGNETGIHTERDMWWSKVLTHLDAKLLQNASFAGSFVTKNPNFDYPSYACSHERIAALGDEDGKPDMIFVLMGANDRGAGVPIASEDKEDITAFENAYFKMLSRLNDTYPASSVVCITPPTPIWSAHPDYHYPEIRNNIPKSAYSRVIINKCSTLNIPVIDITDTLYDTEDGLHPNAQGMQTIAKAVISALLSLSEQSPLW